MENDNIELTAKLSGKCEYSGEVSVKLVDEHNDEVWTKKFHNSGRPNLFKFFANCLLGNWSLVRNQIPYYVVLFDADIQEKTDGPTKNSTFKYDYWKKELVLSPSVHFDTAGYAEPIYADGDDNGDPIGFQSTLHFRIPFTYIYPNAGIYKVGLYPNTTITDYGKELCAYYEFTKSNGDSREWDQIIVPESANNYTIIINWTLKIENK